jgi:hypothetical protein
VRRELPTIVLLGTQLLLVGVTLTFHWAVQPGLVSIYRDSGTAMPAPAAVSLGGWLLPAAVAASLVLTLIGMLQSKRGRRLRWLATGVALLGTAFVGSAMAAYLPLLR